MTKSHNVAGQSAHSCMTENGLDESKLIMTEKEFEKHKGTFVIKIEGLTANDGTNPVDQGHGWKP